MRHLRAIAMLSAFALAACAANPKPIASESEILAAAKRLSARDCAPGMHPKERAVGCRYSATFTDGRWQVRRIYKVVDRGQRVGTSDDLIYIFDRTGKLIKVVGGT